MAQARNATPAAAPTAGSAVFIVSVLGATARTLSAAPGARGGAGASVDVAAVLTPTGAERPAVAAAGTPDWPRPGRLIGDGPPPVTAGPTTHRSLRRPIRRPRKTGSYLVSTTRSFSGMMPLSVMWMPSGHTSVQHLVMLQ